MIRSDRAMSRPTVAAQATNSKMNRIITEVFIISANLAKILEQKKIYFHFTAMEIFESTAILYSSNHEPEGRDASVIAACSHRLSSWDICLYGNSISVLRP